MTSSVAKNWMNRGERCRGSNERSKDCRLKESLQHQLQEVERKRYDLMPEHQRVQKRSQKIQSIQDEKICRKRAWRQEKKCGKSEKKLIGKKSDSVCCRMKSTKNTMADAEMEAELQ